MKEIYLIVFVLVFSSLSQLFAVNDELWSHIENADELTNKGVETSFALDDGARVLNLTQSQNGTYAWTSILAPAEGWELDNAQFIEAEITNTSASAVEVILWVVPDMGWDAIAHRITLEAGASKQFQCNLRATYKDGTPKLNPDRIKKVEVMFSKASVGASLQVKGLTYSGTVSDWVMPEGRITVPNMELGAFGAGKRVRYQLAEDKNTDIYSVLYLPETWTSEGQYPVIVEFPGSIYYTNSVYSTGLPEQCAIGYGMSKNEEAIWVSVPFVDYTLGTVVEGGWGNADNTTDYTLKIVNVIISKFGGDKDNIVLTGFSRGAIACGYIGRRNDEIAALWKGFHACQHYDGDGWSGADMAGAKERAKRIGNRPIFHTDNDVEELKTMLAEVDANVTYVGSGLGAHATAMFLDNRYSTQKLRTWYHNLINDIPLGPIVLTKDTTFHETFTNVSTKETWTSETYIGDSGFEWTYNGKITSSANQLYKTNAMIATSAKIPGGISSFSVECVNKWGDDILPRTIELLINDEVVGAMTSYQRDSSYTFLVTDLDIKDDITIAIKTSGQTIFIDNISWTTSISIPTSVSSKDVDHGIHVYPNFFSTNITIDTDGTISQADLFDMSGRLVVSKPIKGQTRTIITPSYSVMPAGLYILKLLGDDGAEQMKVIRK